MADIDRAVGYYLENYAGLAALQSTRVYRLTMPKDPVFPLTVFTIFGGNVTQPHGEKSILPRPRLQITHYGIDASDVIALEKQSNLALDGFAGTWGISPYNTEIQGCLVNGGWRDDREPQTGLYSRQRDYFVMYKE